MLEFKDTIANLTLTGSNSSLGNKSFVEKRDMPIKGYKASKLFLNTWICEQEAWDLEKLDNRFNVLYQHIIKIWKIPHIKTLKGSQEIVFYCQNGKAYGKLKYISPKKFLILEGSRANKNFVESADRNVKIFNELIEQGKLLEKDDCYIFSEDYIATSPSAAARLILGRSANGWTEWRTFEGERLALYREIFEKRKE